MRTRSAVPAAVPVLLLALAACSPRGGEPADPPAVTAAAATKRYPAAGPPRLVTFAAQAQPLDELLDDLPGLFELRAEDELRPARSDVGPTGINYLRLQQYYRGVPLVGAQVIVAHQDGFALTLTGNFRAAVDADVTSAVSSGGAAQMVIDAARAQIGAGPRAGLETASLVLVDDGTGTGALRLAYAIEQPFDGDRRLWGQVDARTGALVSLDDGRRAVAATTVHPYDGVVAFDTTLQDGLYRLETEDGLVHTLDAFGSPSPPGQALPAVGLEVTSATTTFPSSNATSAHYGIMRATEFLLLNWQRHGWNGLGTQLPVYANVGVANAYFMPATGHIQIGNTWAGAPADLGALDVAAHEVGHGVVYSTVGVTVPGTLAGFIQSGESGALAESFCDALGTMVEFHAQGAAGNWTIAEDVTPGGWRDMQYPTNKSHPDAYASSTWQSTVDNGSNDSGNIHTNNGVGNKWFYLLADAANPAGKPGVNGKGQPYHVRPLGLAVAGRLAYETLFNIAPSAGYHDARNATLAAATQRCTIDGQPLLDTQASVSVWDAWNAVDVGLAVGVTAGAYAFAPVVPAPGAATADPSTLKLQFLPDGDEDAYTIQISTTPDFASPIVFAANPSMLQPDPTSGVPMITVPIPPGTLVGNTPYHWRVLNDRVGLLPSELALGCYRAPHTFTTGAWTAVPTSPIGGAEYHPWDLPFTWDTRGGVVDYEVELYNGAAITDDLEYATTVAAADLPLVLDVRIDRDYWWRVRPVKAMNNGDWSPLQHFTTDTPLGDLVAPSYGSRLYPWGIELEWEPVPGADSHRLELMDDPDCWPAEAGVEVDTVYVEGDEHTRIHSFQPTWDGHHMHCWRVTPIGPELFISEYSNSKYSAEEGVTSGEWTLTTRDAETLPGSITPLDKVNDPGFWQQRAPALLFPSQRATEETIFSYEGVPHATAYDIETFPIMGLTYSPGDLFLLVGQVPPDYIPATPSGPEGPPLALGGHPSGMALGYFHEDAEMEHVYGFWYRIIAIGPDGTRSPNPPWHATTSESLFPGDVDFKVPHDYARLVDQETARNSGVILVKPAPVELESAAAYGGVIDVEPDPYMMYSGVALPAGGAGQLWAPWGGYSIAQYTGHGCDPDNMIGLYWGGTEASDWMTGGFSFESSSSHAQSSIRIRSNYHGHDNESDPAKHWAATAFATDSWAQSFVTESNCVDLHMPELDEPEEPQEPEDPDDPPGGAPTLPPVYECGTLVTPDPAYIPSYAIEMHASWAWALAYFDSGLTADSFAVYHEGVPLAWHDCTSGTTEAYGCPNGICEWLLRYDGTSTEVIVEVQPCSALDTPSWEFIVECPL